MLSRTCFGLPRLSRISLQRAATPSLRAISSNAVTSIEIGKALATTVRPSGR